MRTLVLGLGNELYGDDGIGIHVIRKLREGLKQQKPCCWTENIELEECSLSGLSLLDVIVGYERLIIIDTIKRENPETGKIHFLEENDLRHVPGPSPHYVSIPQAIKIGRECGLKVPSEIRIVAVEAKNIYNLGEGLSEEMENALPEIAARVIDMLKNSRK
ncbi:MAG: hydrogenase maturation protease [Candidatus Aminicenantales bacterium]